MVPGTACRGGEFLIREWIKKIGEKEIEEKVEKHAADAQER
jgi:hypothetical protein